MRNAGLEEAQAGIKIARRNINNLRYADDTTLMVESEEEPLDESERGERKSWLKAQHSENEDHGIQSYHFMANRWETVETVADFIFCALKSLQMVIAAMKLTDTTPWKESYDQPRQHVEKQRYTLPAKVHLVKGMVFSVVMYGCESWTVKKAEC